MHAGPVTEKKMFRGLCFMLYDKMCICINETEIMCRIGPEAAEEAVEQPGVRAMIHNGKTMKDFVFIEETALRTSRELNHWVKLALAFNPEAKPSPRKKK